MHTLGLSWETMPGGHAKPWHHKQVETFSGMAAELSLGQ